MNLKKKLKKFFTLKHRPNDGFTLVELIVVIAIMGILGGVGTVGYSGYIKNANKNADKVLVGNIIRAIETGTYSTMFNLDDSATAGSIPYPVGYVVLSTDANAQSNVSSVRAGEVTGDCVFTNGNVTVTSVEKQTKEFSCGGLFCSNITRDVYTNSSVNLKYCITHSKNQPTILTESVSYPIGYTYSGTNRLHTGHNTTETGSFTLNAGDYVAQNGTSQLYKEDSNGKCVFAANNGVVAGNITTDGAGENPIYKALSAAYGEGVPGTNLKYNGWTSDEGADYATFLNDTGDMIEYVKDTYRTLDTMVDLIDRFNRTGITNIDTSNYLSKDYADASDLMESFAGHVVNKHSDKGAWMTTWNEAASYDGVDFTFGLKDPGKYHHDYVYSATKSYNQAFASYCEANGIDPQYTAAIINFTSTPNENGLTNMDTLNTIPRTVNSAAFNGRTGVNTNYTLQNKFREVGNSNDEADAVFEQCKNLYQKYIDNSNGQSPSEKNGEIFYDLIFTMNKTAGAARDDENVANGSFFDYYDNYLSAMSTIYTGVENAVKDGNVVILVNVTNGVVQCEVSPAVADPRNDQ